MTRRYLAAVSVLFTKNRLATRLIIPLAVLALGLAIATAPAQTLGTRVHVSGGEIEGTASSVPGVTEFKGIPYAAPPVGSIRWQPPRPRAKWNGVLEANAYGPDCPSPREMTASPQRHQIPTPEYRQSEDCLYMNIWTPAKATTDKLPVMVWMMGGGFASSSARMLPGNGAKLAAKGVIVVNFNNRVGILGWLAHPALSAESKDHVSGNYGLMDISAALQWIHDNIAAFGGSRSRHDLRGVVGFDDDIHHDYHSFGAGTVPAYDWGIRRRARRQFLYGTQLPRLR